MLSQEILVAGGQSEKEVINMAEMYNPQMDQWEPISAYMSTPRVGLCMVSMGNMIYVMGELDEVVNILPKVMLWLTVTVFCVQVDLMAQSTLTQWSVMIQVNLNGCQFPACPPLGLGLLRWFCLIVTLFF